MNENSAKKEYINTNNINLLPKPVVMIGVLGLWDDSGASVHMREVVSGLHSIGYEPLVICINSENTRPVSANIKEVLIPVVKKRFLLQLSMNVIGTFKAVRAVHKSGAKIVYTRLDPGMFCGLFAARLTNSRLVVELNGIPTVDLELYRPNNKVLILISKVWEYFHYRFANAIIGAPGYVKYVKNHFNINENKLHRVPLGVNTEVFKPINRDTALQKLQLDNTPIVVWVGTIAGWQGLDVLLYAAAKLIELVPKFRVRIIGDGPELANLKSIRDKLGLNKSVHFTGRLPYGKVPMEIAASKVCVCTFPSDRGDEFSISGLKTLNYLSCSRPVVTTKMDEMALIIEKSGAGFFVESENVDAMAIRLSIILLESQLKWEERCLKAKSLIGDARSWPGVCQKIGSVLKELQC